MTRNAPDGGIVYDDRDDDDGLPEVAIPSADAIQWNDAASEQHALKGAELIAEFVKRLPNAPGVYRMFNANGDVLYVGKARSLKKRVTNYAQGRGHSNRITRMVAQTAHMEFVTTRTETEALLLEANLIKRLRPRFDVLLRDDKSFPYILITGDHEAPALFKHRGARARARASAYARGRQRQRARWRYAPVAPARQQENPAPQGAKPDTPDRDPQGCQLAQQHRVEHKGHPPANAEDHDDGPIPQCHGALPQ